jgi:uncharacterized membrane protein
MTEGTRSWLAYLPGAARAVLIVIGVSPFLPLLLGAIPVLHHVGDAFDAWFAFQCHRDQDRSLLVFGTVLPVCSRCFGIYAGLGLGALVLRPRLGVWSLRIWVLLGAAAMVLDVVTESLGWRPPSALVRVGTGQLLAYPVGSTLVWAARTAAGEPRARPPQNP